ncbi:magnesium and cobalt transport protein CorA [Pseudarthrobacter sp. NIBRBAC000502772]|uniref:magnesium and cobalt transport protein CorA n=1 Tax=Pseudarthrobacter sp. NIBRBAC000502772 TaxID=2590775 RepID=UPI0011323F1D|nr:magnesium and cobalt transport protein CorA [Pseudarthrobacter sp. NIBRBAC000502772]QDG68024.1 magnesium and cobalt transport protein CorA [Pseudarthrobacter sp. NIBRBAC000502772]
MTIIDNAVYVDGVRTADPVSLDETYFVLRQREGMAWIGLYRPDANEIRSVAEEFDLSPLAVEDALAGHQRAKLEHYGECVFLVLRPARYLDDVEKVDFGEIHVFVGADYVITVRHAESPDLAKVRQRMESTPEFLALGPEAVLYGILDQVVDEYEPVAAGLENDVDEIEDDLFGADPDVSRRIYELSRQVITFQRATSPLVGILQALAAGTPERAPGPELQDHFRDVLDHVIRLNERVASFRALLQNALAVNAALVAQRQNDEMRKLTESSFAQSEQVKRISSWAAILFAPTLVGTIYGMNFTSMPELNWVFGYPFALGLMVAMGLGLYWTFKHNKWI